MLLVSIYVVKKAAIACSLEYFSLGNKDCKTDQLHGSVGGEEIAALSNLPLNTSK